MKKRKFLMVTVLSLLLFLAGCFNPMQNLNEIQQDGAGESARTLIGGEKTDVISELYLDEYMFPGAHNAFNFKTSKNQNLTISEQLAMGVKTLELDFHKVLVYKFPTFRREIRTAHGLHNTGGVNLLGGTTPVQEILSPIKNFLDTNPEEILNLKLEYYPGGNAWNVSSEEVEEELAKAGLASYLYNHTGGPMPTIGDLQNANKRLIITGFNDLRSFSECAENNPDNFDNTWNLEYLDSSFIYRKQTNILMCFSKDDTIGIGAYDESINNNKYDFLLRFTQRSWLNTGRKPMHLLIDFCDTGDLIAVSERINSYPIYKGIVRNLPSGEELQWVLVYENNGVEISQIGYSDQKYSFPGTIWFGGAYYNLKSLNPLSGGAGISMSCETVSNRGGLTISEREYDYGSGVMPFPIETLPEGTTVTIKNRDSDLYLTISEGSGDNGASAVGDVLNGGQEQKFIINRTGEYYWFKALHSGKRLDVDNPSDPFNAYDAYLQRDQYNQKGHFEEARVHQYSINDKFNQMWKLSRRTDGSYVITSRENGKALTLTEDTVGSYISMNEYCGMPGQSWELIKE